MAPHAARLAALAARHSRGQRGDRPHRHVRGRQAPLIRGLLRTMRAVICLTRAFGPRGLGCACQRPSAVHFRVRTPSAWPGLRRSSLARPHAFGIGANASDATMHFSSCSSGANLRFAVRPSGASLRKSARPETQPDQSAGSPAGPSSDRAIRRKSAAVLPRRAGRADAVIPSRPAPSRAAGARQAAA